MSEQKIEPSQVTKPIQLLAAWLVGLILINGTFLGAAKVIINPDWAAGALVVASIINVPIFLILIFFLQTKFRAELQEDTYYSKHLEKVTGQLKDTPSKDEYFLREIRSIQSSNNNQFQSLNQNLEDLSKTLTQHSISDELTEKLLSTITQAKSSLNEIEYLEMKNSAKIFINDLIPSYKTILKLLIESGFKISDTFGSTSESKKTPRYLTISYCQYTDKTALAEIYKILKPFNFNRIDFDQEDDDSTIYIGSYIDEFPESRKSILIDNKIEEMLFNYEISKEQFNSYVLLTKNS